MKISALLFFSLSINTAASAQEAEPASERIEVTGKKILRGRQREKSSQTETLSGDTLNQFGAHSLADAISQASGVNTQTFCANCGAKRITIDGLRGEHTTILIDGFPMHSTISAFYGVDAIPIMGLAGVEVNRGSGQALLAPEAIGGTINLLTVNPTRENRFKIYSEYGSHGSKLSSFLASTPSLVLSGQRGELENWDIDHNGVGESPYRTTQGLSLKFAEKIGASSALSLRHSEADLLIIGGNIDHYRPLAYTRIQAQPSDFVDNDVTRQFIGDRQRISDLIKLDRKETAVLFSHDLNLETQLRLRLSRVEQSQDANYSHGYDYRNHDQINYAQIELQKTAGEHLLTATVDGRFQAMKSQSDALYIDRLDPLTPDSLHFKSLAVGFLDSWIVSDSWNLDLALRLDQLRIHWDDLGHEVEETVIAPRVNVKYFYDDHLSSQLSYGVGYRPPLTLFESEHGSDHDGFLIQIDRTERADSLVYSISSNYPQWFVTGTLHHTRLEHMAYAFDHVPKGQPMIFKNSEESYGITAADIFAGGRPFESLNIQASFEQFFYPDSYAEKLPAAAIEQRFMLDVDWDSGRWGSGLQTVWIGPRNLSRYGYDAHYKVYDLDVASPAFGQVSQPKNQSAPSFWFANLKARYELTQNASVNFRINNVFDFTQTGRGDSPTTWHYHVNHAHFDNFHTWGPLMGREYFVGLEGRW